VAAGLILGLGAALAPPALRAQPEPAAEARALPTYGEGSFDGPYPVRLLTVETARMMEPGHGTVGFGDTRFGVSGRFIELSTHTITDIVGVANLGLKLGIRQPDGLRPGIVVGGRYYKSYPGALIDKGVRKIAESFADVTDSEVDIEGVVAYATASWVPQDGPTGYHLALQTHWPGEYRFAVEDTVAGGGGNVVFHEGNDVSVMWGVDHRLMGSRLVGMAEAGWSFGLERPRFGLGVDTGSQRWRFVAGVTWPGVETDVATNPRDFFVNPVLSIHYRF
jgi:hypothetical protein